MAVREREAYQVVECATVCGMQAHEIARGIVLGCIAGGKARMHVVTGDDDTRVGALVGEGHMADVLDALYKTLRHRVTREEWASAPRAHQARIAESFYARVRASRDPKYEERAGVRRIDWLLKSAAFVGLTPSVERGYTWTLTTKRVEK